MESIARFPSSKDPQAWNEAYDRLVNFLKTFQLADHAYASQIALEFIRQAREVHDQNPSRPPATCVMDLAQKRLAEWFAANLGEVDRVPSHTLATGYIALLLSRTYRNAPTSFLTSPLPEELRQALRETLIVTGPDLNISSMTPRHFDYGPMLQFARQTWHLWDAREIIVAVIFWACVYTAFYWWLSQIP